MKDKEDRIEREELLKEAIEIIAKLNDEQLTLLLKEMGYYKEKAG